MLVAQRGSQDGRGLRRFAGARSRCGSHLASYGARLLSVVDSAPASVPARQRDRDRGRIAPSPDAVVSGRTCVRGARTGGLRAPAVRAPGAGGATKTVSRRPICHRALPVARWPACPPAGVVARLGLMCRSVAVRVRLHRRWGRCDGTCGWMCALRSSRWEPLRFAARAAGHDRGGGGAGVLGARRPGVRGHRRSVHVRRSGDDRHRRAVRVAGRVGHDVVSVEWLVRWRHGRVRADRQLDQPGQHVRERLVAVPDGADRR